MARTWQQHLDAEDRLWHICVRIEGVGPVQWVTQLDATGRYAFCVAPPLYSSTSVLWLPLMTELPGVLSERASPLGGWPEAGNLTLSLLDRDDLLTAVMGYTERPPVAALTADVSATEQEWVLGTGEGAQFAYGQCFWCDGEALRIIEVSGDTITVIRGWMGTDATEHAAASPVFASNPYVVGRRVELFLGPQDGSNASEQLIGQYVVDAIAWDPTTGIWQLQAQSQLKYLDKIIRGREPRLIVSGGTRFGLEGRTYVAGRGDEDYDIWPLWSTSTHARVLDTGEIVRLRIGGDVFARGLVGTTQQDVNAGNHIEQVMTCEEGDFRFSDPALEHRHDYSVATTAVTVASNVATATVVGHAFVVGENITTSGHTTNATVATPITAVTATTVSYALTASDGALADGVGVITAADEWTQSAHFVDLLLCILTSSAQYSDGLELVNYDETTGVNWSCLLPGFGLGIPAAQIDFDSFLSVKSRTPGWDFNWFVLGGGKTAKEALHELLEVTGCFLSTAAGTLALVLPRMPMISEDVPDVDTDSVIREPGGIPLDGAMSVAIGAVASSVRYELGPNKVPLDLRSADFESTFGQRMVYSRESRPAVIGAPSIAPGAGSWLASIAAGRLLRWRLPRLELVRVVDWSLYPDSSPGTIVGVTAEEVPDFGTGARGASARPFVVVEREPRVADGGMMLRMQAWGSGIRAGRISPSAYVASANPDTGPPAITTLTIEADRYVSGDNAAGFVAGDKVALINRDGSVHQAGLEVVSVSANTIVIDDDLAGVADKVLVFDVWSDLTADRRARYVAYASTADRKIEDTGTPFVHGER